MRLQASKPIKLRNKVLGGQKPLICVPLASVDEASLINEIDEVIRMKPDVIEWRADYFERILDFSKVKHILEIIRTKTQDIPIVFTCRSHEEGGYKKIDDDRRLKLFQNVMESIYVDVVDIELAFGKEKIEQIKSLAAKNGVKVILSYHNFTKTPSEEFMIEKIKEQLNNGADIPKIAVMPQEQGDVLRLLNATYRARKEIQNPLIAISMGSLGIITRMTGFIFGSDMTFAAGVNASAPGQMPIEEMRRYIEIIL
ncbi:MAG: type I 3-dehydroquinate dehydratase [Lutispora sp.]